MGPPGSGKTDSLTTVLIHPSIEKLVVLGTEPRFHESLIDSIDRRKLDRKKLAYHYVPPTRTPIASLLETAQLVHSLTYQGLADIKAGIQKQRYTQWIELLKTLQEFKDDITGASLGPTWEFPSNWVFAVDSLSGLNIMAKDLVVGAKPTLAQGEWGVAMDQEERLINEMSSNIKSLFVLTAHIERETDQISGGTRVTVGALGNKLGPKIPRFFSEVITTKATPQGYMWSTSEHGYDLKRRSLPISDKLEPSFVPIIEAWRKRSMETSNG
jgi:hypothetical protein